MSALAQQIEYAANSMAMARRSNRAASAMAEAAETNREAIYAALVRAARPCSCREIADLAGVSREGAHEHLKVLLERGTVLNISKARGAIYTVPHLANARTHQVDPMWLENLEAA